MINLTQYQQQIAEQTSLLLEKHMASLPDSAAQLKQAMAYSLLSGGKRLRPFLVHASGDMLGVNPDKLVPLALAIECIHCYSLIHDDLPAMDDDDLRRGKLTCHIAFDEATAILAGDALQTLAFTILANAESIDAQHRVELVQLLANASGVQGMCGGQAIDLAATNQTIDQRQLELMHSMKTGALIKVAVHMVCVLAENLTNNHKQQLLVFAERIGLAFQVRDDILDVIGDSDTLGKPRGSDQAANKSTFPAILGLSGAQHYLTQLHTEALHALRALPYNSELLQAFSDYIIDRDH